MAVVRWTPKREWETLWREFERLFGGALPAVFEPEEANGYGWRPRVDMHETDAAYVVETDLPGMAAADITVEVKGPYVVLKGERHAEHEETKEGVKRVERTFGTFYRRVALPETAKAEEAEARYANGVLRVTVPKTVEAKAKHVDVKAA
jgi:HSP20 family protein